MAKETLYAVRVDWSEVHYDDTEKCNGSFTKTATRTQETALKQVKQYVEELSTTDIKQECEDCGYVFNPDFLTIIWHTDGNCTIQYYESKVVSFIYEIIVTTIDLINE